MSLCWTLCSHEPITYRAPSLPRSRFPERFRRCVFYGDLYPNRECYDENVAQGLKRLMDARRKFAYGQRTDYFQQVNCVGFLRKGDGSRGGCAVLVSNADCPEKQEG